MRSLVKLIEDKNCYFSQEQRKILVNLFKNETIRINFFLTGGTALSVFHLHHRKSNDIDLFTIHKPEFHEIEYSLKNYWKRGLVRLKLAPYILSVDINEIKVDLVHDPLSFDDKKVVHQLEGDNAITVDSLINIVSNKLCTLVSRQEPKDFIDFYFISKMKLLDFDSIYNGAQKKEGMFDDPPMVAYQVEYNLNEVKQNPFAFPEMVVDFDMNEFYTFYEDLIQKIYHRK